MECIIHATDAIVKFKIAPERKRRCAGYGFSPVGGRFRPVGHIPVIGRAQR